MKLHLLGLPLIAALVLAIGTMAAACGADGEELTLEEYFHRMAVVHGEAGDQVEALAAEASEMLASASTDEEVIDANRDFLNASALVFNDLIDDLDALDPPAQAEASHNELVAGVVAQAAVMEDFADQYEDVKTWSEAQKIADEIVEALDAVQLRELDACFTLQRIADDNGVAVDLECGE